MGVTFEDYNNLLERCEQVKDLDKEIGEIKKEWDRLTAKFFETSTKEDIIEALQSIWTRLDNEMGDQTREEQWNSFVAYLSYCSDRMNINRWCRLQLLIGNVQSH